MVNPHLFPPEEMIVTSHLSCVCGKPGKIQKDWSFFEGQHFSTWSLEGFPSSCIKHPKRKWFLKDSYHLLLFIFHLLFRGGQKACFLILKSGEGWNETSVISLQDFDIPSSLLMKDKRFYVRKLRWSIIIAPRAWTKTTRDSYSCSLFPPEIFYSFSHGNEFFAALQITFSIHW